MDPPTVARLLAEMDPREAVLLLSALGDREGRLVSEGLPQAERRRLIEVRVLAGHLSCGRLGMFGSRFANEVRQAHRFRFSTFGPSAATPLNPQVLQSAEDAPASKQWAARAKLKGSFRDCQDTAEVAGRIASAFEVGGGRSSRRAAVRAEPA
jgi:hypothetical protein